MNRRTRRGSTIDRAEARGAGGGEALAIRKSSGSPPISAFCYTWTTTHSFNELRGEYRSRADGWRDRATARRGAGDRSGERLLRGGGAVAGERAPLTHRRAGRARRQEREAGSGDRER